MRWIIRLVALVVVLALVAVGSLLFLPGDRIARIAADQITRMTGRAVTLEGDTRISFYPVLGVSTGAITIANASWAGETPMFRADSLKVGVEPQALWGGDIRITGLEAVAPEITLHRAADGRVNWELGVENVAPSGQASTDGATSAPAESRRLALTLDRALITNATLTYIDDGAGRTTRQSGVDFDLRWPDYEGTAEFSLVLRPAGQPVTIAGHLDRVAHFIDGGVSDIAVTVNTRGGEIAFAGRAGSAPEAAGRFSTDIADIKGFLGTLGLSGIELPAGIGPGIAAAADLTYTRDTRLALRDMAVELGGNAVTGGADLALAGDKPRLNLQLNADALDFSSKPGQGGASGDTATAAASSAGWSTDPIDASALAWLDAEVALVANSIDLGDLTLGKTRTLATLTRSRLVFDIRELRAYKGLITGQFVVNNRSGLSVGGDLAATDIDLQTLLTETMEVTRLSGTADGTLKFLGVGNTMQTIMSSLSGEGSLKTGRGVISGIDLDRLMRSGDATGGTTVFDSASATFRMEDGNLFNDDLTMILPLARASGAGRIGLGARDIDYVFTPRLLDGGSGNGLAIPVKIRGPWANPRITPDLEAAIDLNFNEEKKEIERKARREVEREVEKQLGITRQEGQSLEDAAKDALEKELERGILKLVD
ncbi:AsmA family protein [Roseovarius aestuariivivens]|uniref:AsmA family protein n=1 Tax=Roseovarius aestuariivivens TaxID=1888910 RepID=UPI001081F515|nr:AsmA family protein [Roseovarius aestuariivivens]